MGAPKSLQMVTAAMKLKDTYSLEENLDSMLKSRDMTLPTKVCLVTAMVFPVVRYGCESWTVKKAAAAAAAAKLLQSCPTPSDPMDCSLPGSSIHGICQARVLKWGAIAFSTVIFRW